jgi:hypothetical protein
LILSEYDGNVYIGDLIRDIICIINASNSVGIGNEITINKQRLEREPQEYPENLIKFMEEFKNMKQDLVN